VLCWRKIIVDERLQKLLQELGNAINESLSDSERIMEVIREIRRAGYDVFLVLEATIGFNKCEAEDSEGEPEEDFESMALRQELEPAGRIRFTSQDQKFLRALKITLDDEPAA